MCADAMFHQGMLEMGMDVDNRITGSLSGQESFVRRVEVNSERMFFNARWLSAPLYAILAISLALITIRGVRDLISLVIATVTGQTVDFLLEIIELVDLSLVANLVTTVMFAGYENYISRMDIKSHQDYPSWLLKITFAQIKTKVTSTITVMSGMNLLKMCYNTDKPHAIYASAFGFLCFVVATMVFAYIEHMHAKDGGH